MMRYLRLLVLMVVPLIITACSSYENPKDYRFAEDGLIYNIKSGKLYTGTIVDTSKAILHYEVVNGKKNGTFLVYYPDGTIAQSGYLIDNKNVGEWKYFYPNGKLECKGMYINDIPQGEWVFHFPDGKLKSKGKYKDGTRHGFWYEYEDTGALKVIYIFRNGDFVDFQNRKT
jgi:antitoxin component YwqK of YwqJK toxin-antitoxin module